MRALWNDGFPEFATAVFPVREFFSCLPERLPATKHPSRTSVTPVVLDLPLFAHWFDIFLPPLLPHLLWMCLDTPTPQFFIFLICRIYFTPSLRAV